MRRSPLLVGIGRLAFALSGAQLIEMLPPGLPLLDLPAREVLARGNHAVGVEGPCVEPEAAARAVVEGTCG